MSFQLICQGCGAISGPSTGVCPFCKASLAPKGRKESSTAAQLRKHYREGNLARALTLVSSTESDDHEFLLLSAKVLVEAEGPNSRIRALLGKVLLKDPDNAEAAEYLDLIEAKGMLGAGLNDAGEQRLRELLRRSPENPYALFHLGAHLFWVEKEAASAVRLLEKCVRLRPGLLRAWGCLGSIYQALGNPQLATRAFQRCIALETDPKMKDFFLEMLDKLNAEAA